MELHHESQNLLEKLANSVYDRHPNLPILFSAKEIHIVENFLKDYAKDKFRQAGEY